MAKRKKDPIRDWADSDLATKWANDVVGGRIVTKLMPLAAERHLRDKEVPTLFGVKTRPPMRWSGHNISSRLSFALSRRKQGFESPRERQGQIPTLISVAFFA
jgi:hypothetical protein